MRMMNINTNKLGVLFKTPLTYLAIFSFSTYIGELYTLC